MTELAIGIVLGVAIGGAGAWLIARPHFAARAAAEREGLRALVASAETRGDELRKQLDQRGLEVSDLRTAGESERVRRAEAEAHAEAARRSAEDQRRLLDEARERLATTFKALSAEALRESSNDFLRLAEATIDSQLARREQAVDAIVTPLRDTLERYDQQLRDIEKARTGAYAGLEEQLRALASSSAELGRTAGNLVTALRGSDVRGRWGEITLRRVVELVGMTTHCDFDEQTSIDGDERRLRPDLIVHLPERREVVVDAKVPLAAYLDAVAAATPKERQAGFVRHAAQVRQHISSLAGKAYGEQVPGALDFVVMFIPGEPVIAAAVEADPDVIEYGMSKRVIVATPTTLWVLLRAFAEAWRQQQLATNAAKISELGKELYNRMRILGEYFDDIGASLKGATSAYNKAVVSMERRVLVSARRFRDLGAAGSEEIPPLEPIDELPRELSAPEFPKQLDVPEASA